MSIINSNTTGHSPRQEKKFSKKLFIGLGLLAAAAFAIVLLMSQQKDMSAKPDENNLSDSNTPSAPIPAEEQPKN